MGVLSFLSKNTIKNTIMSDFKICLNLDEHTAPWWEDPIYDIIQLDDGNIACCGQPSAHVHIWCPNTGSLIKEIQFSDDLKGKKELIHRIALLSNGMIACGGAKGSLIICNPNSGLIKSELEGHDSCIESLYVLNDDSLVSYSNGKIKMWNSNTGQLKREIDADFGNMLEDPVEGELVILSNTQFILTGNRGPIWDQTTYMWNKELGFDIGETFYCEKDRILGVDDNESLYILNKQLGKTIISRKTGSGVDCITKIASLNDGRVITGHGNGIIKIWDSNGHVSIELFDDLNIDNLFVMKNDKIITFAEDKGTIWSIPSA